MKKIKYLFMTLIITFLFTSDAYALDDSFDIQSYDVDIKVNENNSFDITENIMAYFYYDKHGIYREIPLSNKVEREDGTSSSNRAIISNVSVSHPYTTSKENGNYVIQIGDANKYISGYQNYTISYNYTIGKDKLKESDEFYFNIIGTAWDVAIKKVTFKITMPKSFDETLLGFTAGTYGSLNTSGIKYNVDGNVITGSYEGVLNPGEGLTVRLTLDEGYFAEATSNLTTIDKMMFIIPLICVFLAFLFWFRYGRDEKEIETVEFYPPEGFNSLEIGFIHKGETENKDVISLLIYLANKGYISIEEPNNKGFLSMLDKFKIIKLKEYDGKNEFEKMFFNGLFSNTVLERYNLEKTTSKTEVSESDLRNTFYVTLNKILSKVNSKENKWKIFTKDSLSKKTIIIIMMLLTVMTAALVPTVSYGGYEMIITTIILVLFYSIFYYVIFIKNSNFFTKIVAGGFIIFHSSMFFMALPVGTAVMSETLYLYGVIFAIICIIIMSMFLKIVPKRNAYGNKLLGRIEGFKTFLETAEKSQLEAQVLNNPTYFYDILPYTYVLGVSDKWIEKFESIAIEEPNWYHGNTAFSVSSFGSFMNSTMKSAESSMSSSPSSSGGGGSSGGGSSGGGSGGGGGGSW